MKYPLKIILSSPPFSLAGFNPVHCIPISRPAHYNGGGETKRPNHGGDIQLPVSLPQNSSTTTRGADGWACWCVFERMSATHL